MPLPTKPTVEKRGPWWYLEFARMNQVDRTKRVQDIYFGKPAEYLNDAAFAMVNEACRSGHWQALADTLPELRRMMGVVG